MEDKKPASSGSGDPSPEELVAKVNAPGEEVDALDPKNKTDKPDDTPKPVTSNVKKVSLISKLNIYLMAFILVIVIAAAVMAVLYTMNKKEQNVATNTLDLTQQVADQLKSSDAKVGGPKQILTIESNTIITGKAIVQSDLDVAGSLKLGGALSIPSITVTGATNLGAIKANSIELSGDATVGGKIGVAGDATIGGAVTAAGDITNNGNLSSSGSLTVRGSITASTGSLTVRGGGTFGGTLSAGVVKAGEIQFGKLAITGGQPTIQNGPSIGGGGTTSVQGSDSAGTATINIGGGAGAGVLATVRFSSAFSSTPHPVITPMSTGCATAGYYITGVTTTQFQIAVTNAPAAGNPCRFSFIVIGN